MIDRCLEQWHEFVKTGDRERLAALLADDVVFHSPIVFTPQEGKALTMLYLMAAYGTFGGDGSSAEASDPTSSFRYTKRVASGHHAVLEFETRVDGKFVNGVDVITCDDDARIVEFRVMLRPLQAVNLMHRRMAAMLESMQPRDGAEG